MRTVPLLSAVEGELARAAEHYEDEAPHLGEEFLQEFERALERIATFPTHGTPYIAGPRRVVLQRFPFQIIYSVDVSRPLVVALAHQKQRPGYWLERV
ncbi:MAG TPA: type II toxin-antitoxin system RelE/ParE family toxin [Longimicrobiaceae bacterium]